MIDRIYALGPEVYARLTPTMRTGAEATMGVFVGLLMIAGFLAVLGIWVWMIYTGLSKLGRLFQ